MCDSVKKNIRQFDVIYFCINNYLSVLCFVKGSSTQDARRRGDESSGVRAENAAGQQKPEPRAETKPAEQQLKQWDSQRQ